MGQHVTQYYTRQAFQRKGRNIGILHPSSLRRNYMISAKVGNFPVAQLNKYVEEVQGIALKEVTLIPAANYSLFSLANRHK